MYASSLVIINATSQKIIPAFRRVQGRRLYPSFIYNWVLLTVMPLKRLRCFYLQRESPLQRISSNDRARGELPGFSGACGGATADGCRFV